MAKTSRNLQTLVRALRQRRAAALGRGVVDVRRALGSRADALTTATSLTLCALCDEDLQPWEESVLANELRRRGASASLTLVYRIWTAGEPWSHMVADQLAAFVVQARRAASRAGLWLPPAIQGLAAESFGKPARALTDSLREQGIHLGNLSGRRLGFPVSRKLGQAVATHLLGFAPDSLITKIAAVAARGDTLKVLRPGGDFVKALARRSGQEFPASLMNPRTLERDLAPGFVAGLNALSARGDGAELILGWLAVRARVIRCHTIDCVDGRVIMFLGRDWFAVDRVDSFAPTHVFSSGETMLVPEALMRPGQRTTSFQPSRPWYGWGARTALIGGAVRPHRGTISAGGSWLVDLQGLIDT